LYELPLIEALQREQRSFMKPLKYDARSGLRRLSPTFCFWIAKAVRSHFMS